MVKHLNIKIFGRVHNVGFRFGAAEAARELKILGFARNEFDGSVYIEAEGEEKDLQKFLEWCEKGPSWSGVEKVVKSEGEIKNYLNFDIY
jgi:acylphosphatase